MYLRAFCRQTWALVKKNLIIVCVRSWLSTFIRGYVIPIALITLLLNIQNFAKDTNAYGFGNSFLVQDLAHTIGNKKLVLVREMGISLDVQHVLDTITKPLDAAKLVLLNSTDEVEETCPVDFHGNSPCHAVVIFQDSPLSEGGNASWRYTIRTDPSQAGSGFNVFNDASAVDRVFLPLQVAIENAITNSTEMPEALKYTFAGTQADADEAARKLFQTATLYILSCVFFFSLVPIAQQVSAMVARDREAGMSQLIDSMTGGAAWPRIVSYIVTFDLIYFPLWIILGCCKLCSALVM
jgi:ATP-binding cassette, subfamily A (ABC1), member 3